VVSLTLDYRTSWDAFILNSEVEGTIPRSPGSRTFKFWNSATRYAVSQPTGLVRGSFLGEKSL
jgi:hypothetical protein